MLAVLSHIIALTGVRFGQFYVMVASAAEHGEEGGALTDPLPSLAYYIAHYCHAEWVEHWVNVFYAFAIALLFMFLAMRAYSKREMIPGPFQNAIEMIVEGLFNFFHSILGDDARKYAPFLGTLFIYILAMNWIGMLPLGHAPSTSLEITGSLAIIVFIYAQCVGIKRLGIGGYLHHMAGSPNDVIGWSMVILMFPLHLIGELAKPLSLALRLFGNITGEDTLIAVFVSLGVAITPFIGSIVGIPIQTPFYFLGLLLSTVQALVFSLLACIYILLMLPHEEHAH
ncbi:MAG TPA: F0F1 ATP synthase subunit A [candidate division Zixibacteria bacterium]|nr:F0F1 ATP synthase subunit A [candidate division Zixibacteria bacterium]